MYSWQLNSYVKSAKSFKNSGTYRKFVKQFRTEIISFIGFYCIFTDKSKKYLDQNH